MVVSSTRLRTSIFLLSKQYGAQIVLYSAKYNLVIPGKYGKWQSMKFSNVT